MSNDVRAHARPDRAAAPARRGRGPATWGRGVVTRIATGLAVAGPLLVAGITVAVVWTHLGQRADERSAWSIIVPREMSDVLQAWLALVSVPTILLVLAGCVLVALARRLPSRALGVIVLVAGANVSTQVLKVLIPRPSYGVGHDGNSLPSGHTTVMLSLGLAVIAVAPRPLRPLAVFLTAAAGTLTGASTVLERWHRPSDVIAAYGVCAFWAGVALLVTAWAQRGDLAAPDPRRRRRFAMFVGAGVLGAVAVGVVLVAGGLVAHGKASNVIVGGVTLTAAGLGSALVSAVAASGVDALRGWPGPGSRAASTRQA